MMFNPEVADLGDRGLKLRIEHFDNTAPAAPPLLSPVEAEIADQSFELAQAAKVFPRGRLRRNSTSSTAAGRASHEFFQRRAEDVDLAREFRSWSSR